MSFSKYFTKEKNAVPFAKSKAGRTVMALLLAMVFVILETGEGRTSETWPLWWREHVKSLRAQGKDVKVMKSKNMTPEKSPEEFLLRYKKIREQAGKNFTFQTFVEDVARGLVIEQRYHETKGVLYTAKENLNQNYFFRKNLPYETYRKIAFNCQVFCITPELLRKIFGKEDSILAHLPQLENVKEVISASYGKG